MQHLDDDALAASALGDARPEDAAHLAICDTCRVELEAYQAVAVRVAGSSGSAPLSTPRARVWDAIAAEIASDGDAAAHTEPEVTAGAATTAASAGPTDDLAARRARRRAPAWALVAAAAGGIVLGAGAVAGGLSLGTADAPATVVAQAPLSDLATEEAAGTAVLETRADGTEVLVVDTGFTEFDDAFLEVWLIDENVEGMVSLGHLTSERTEFVLPAGFDPSAFPIVDISVEPLDGVPTHSGDSRTRGVLDV